MYVSCSIRREYLALLWFCFDYCNLKSLGIIPVVNEVVKCFLSNTVNSSLFIYVNIAQAPSRHSNANCFAPEWTAVTWPPTEPRLLMFFVEEQIFLMRTFVYSFLFLLIEFLFLHPFQLCVTATDLTTGNISLK